jgi:hypothetical protein
MGGGGSSLRNVAPGELVCVYMFCALLRSHLLWDTVPVNPGYLPDPIWHQVVPEQDCLTAESQKERPGASGQLLLCLFWIAQNHRNANTARKRHYDEVPQAPVAPCSVHLVAVYVNDRLCGLVVGVPGYRSRGPGSISGATRLSEK